MINQTIALIDQTLGKIRTHPEYSRCLTRKIFGSIRNEADRHSTALEDTCEGNISYNERERTRKISNERLLSARNFLYDEGLSVYSVSCLGNILEPTKNPNRKFRRAEVEFGYFSGGVGVAREFSGEDSSKIMYKIEDLIGRTKFSTEIHPIIRASDIHLSMIQTHPYVDGNGRAARLVQDYFLESSAYPSATILSDRKQEYIDIIQEAMRDRVSGNSTLFDPSQNEVAFQNFIASRVLSASKSLEKELSKNRAYRFELKKVKSHRMTMKVKHSLTYVSGKQVHTHLDSNKKSKNPTMCITGDISLEELSPVIRKIGEKYNLKYNLRADTEC